MVEVKRKKKKKEFCFGEREKVNGLNEKEFFFLTMFSLLSCWRIVVGTNLMIVPFSQQRSEILKW